MHREERVVERFRHAAAVGFEHLVHERNLGVRPRELDAHQESEDASQTEKDNAREQKLNADNIVIFGENVLAEKSQLMMAMSFSSSVRCMRIHNSNLDCIRHL